MSDDQKKLRQDDLRDGERYITDLDAILKTTPPVYPTTQEAIEKLDFLSSSEGPLQEPGLLVESESNITDLPALQEHYKVLEEYLLGIAKRTAKKGVETAAEGVSEYIDMAKSNLGGSLDILNRFVNTGTITGEVARTAREVVDERMIQKSPEIREALQAGVLPPPIGGQDLVQDLLSVFTRSTVAGAEETVRHPGEEAPPDVLEELFPDSFGAQIGLGVVAGIASIPSLVGRTGERAVKKVLSEVLDDQVNPPQLNIFPSHTQSLNQSGAIKLPTVKSPDGTRMHVVPKGEVPPTGAVTEDFAQDVTDGIFRDLRRVEVRGLGNSWQDPIRMVEKMEGVHGSFRRNVMWPIEDAAHRNMVEEIETLAKFQDIVMQTGIKMNSKSSYRIFKYVEQQPSIPGQKGAPGKVNTQFDLFNTPEMIDPIILTDKERIMERWIRSNYDTLIDRINKVNRENGLPLVNKLPNYMTHIWKMSLKDHLFDFFKPNKEIDDFINTGGGLKKVAASKSPFFAYGLHRKGAEGFQEDAVFAFSEYLGSALRRIHMTTPVHKSFGYIKHLPPNAGDYFDQWVRVGALQKASEFDKTVFNYPKGLKSATDIANYMSDNVARALIVGNLSTAALQVSAVPQIFSGAGPLKAARAIFNVGGFRLRYKGRDYGKRISPDFADKVDGQRALVFSMGPGWDFANEVSQVLFNRRATRYEDVISVAKLAPGRKRAERLLSWAIKAGDELSVVWAFNAGYIKATEQLGMFGKEAIRYADDFARKSQGSFTRLYKPPILNDRQRRVWTQFQNYPMNIMNHLGYDVLFKDEPFLLRNMPNRKKRLFEEHKKTRNLIDAATFVAASYGITQVYDRLGLPAPFESVLSFVPFGTIMRSMVPQIGSVEKLTGAAEATVGRTGVPAALQTANQLAKNTTALAMHHLSMRELEPAQYKRHIQRLYKHTLLMSGQPGANQFAKTTLALSDLKNGYTYTTGRKKIRLDARDVIPSLLWGTYWSPSVVRHREGKKEEGAKIQIGQVGEESFEDRLDEIQRQKEVEAKESGREIPQFEEAGSEEELMEQMLQYIEEGISSATDTTTAAFQRRLQEYGTDDTSQ